MCLFCPDFRRGGSRKISISCVFAKLKPQSRPLGALPTKTGGILPEKYKKPAKTGIIRLTFGAGDYIIDKRVSESAYGLRRKVTENAPAKVRGAQIICADKRPDTIRATNRWRQVGRTRRVQFAQPPRYTRIS